MVERQAQPCKEPFLCFNYSKTYAVCLLRGLPCMEQTHRLCTCCALYIDTKDADKLTINHSRHCAVVHYGRVKNELKGNQLERKTSKHPPPPHSSFVRPPGKRRVGREVLRAVTAAGAFHPGHGRTRCRASRVRRACVLVFCGRCDGTGFPRRQRSGYRRGRGTASENHVFLEVCCPSTAQNTHKKKLIPARPKSGIPGFPLFGRRLSTCYLYICFPTVSVMAKQKKSTRKNKKS